ncbi:MAG: cyclic nucleotide-binding domain-containing protein [Pyrinomonadaceae bacterium]
MNLLQFKRRLTFPIIASLLAGLAVTALYALAPTFYAKYPASTGLYGKTINAAEALAFVALAFVFVRLANEIIFSFFFRLRKGYEAPNLIRNIFSIIAYVALFALIVQTFYPTIQLGALFTTSAIFGVILGLALQDTLGNLFAGVSLHADNPFLVGDVIMVGKWTGVVESITWRAVKIRTFTNHIVLVSNSNIAKESIEVCPRTNLNARTVSFSAPYTDSPVTTIKVVREAVRKTENVSQKLTPIVRIKNLAGSEVEYEIKYWLDDFARYNDTDALIRQRVWYAFQRARLQFASPTLTVNLTREAKDGAAKDGDEVIERLKAVDIFSPLSPEEIGKLACAVASHVYAPGETVIHAGDEGSSMFVVHRGRVEVRISDNGTPLTVAQLDEGDFFGEMALLTGEPRTANIVAADETEVLEVGHEALKLLFDTNPQLVNSLGEIVAERRTHLAANSKSVQETAEETAGLLNSIKRFFGL